MAVPRRAIYPDTNDATRRGNRHNDGSGSQIREILLTIGAILVFPLMMLWVIIKGFFGGLAIEVDDRMGISLPQKDQSKNPTTEEKKGSKI